VAAVIDWSPDGKWLAYDDAENGGPLNGAFLLNMETLESHEVPHDPRCRHEGFLGFSHSGKQLLHLCVSNTLNFTYSVTDVEGKSRREITTRSEFPSSAIWTADDQYVILAAQGAEHEELYQIRVSDGETRKLANIGGEWPTLSHDGHKLAYAVGEYQYRIWRKDLQNPKAPAVEMFPSSRSQNNAQYSPDGEHVAFDSKRSGIWSVWLGDSDGRNLVQISQGELAGYPQWSPDSRKIAFIVSEADGTIGTYIANIADRVPHKLKTNISSANMPYWSHDGEWIYFLGYENNGHQLYRCPAKGGDATLLAGSLDLTEPIESADGKTLYFAARYEDADMMTLELNRPGATPQRIAQMPKIRDENQMAVTKEGIYFSPQERPRSIDFYDFRTRQTRELFQVDKDLAEGMSVSPDGRYLMYSQTDESNSSIMLVNDFRP
jgi:Tol biopolymer transport system component